MRIFVASPEGLEKERRSIQGVVQEVNVEAGERQVDFILARWELLMPGFGRPQDRINEELRRSDYLVLLLHDRWGTPPSGDTSFTSRSEEEFHLARECLLDPKMPMRDLAILFKVVDPTQLFEPSPQLRSVLAFRANLEEEEEFLFGTFDSGSGLEKRFRRLLFRWLRDLESVGDDPIPHLDDLSLIRRMAEVLADHCGNYLKVTLPLDARVR